MTSGYWEAKDSHDDLDAEIQAKFNRGYPKDNIVFEDSETATWRCGWTCPAPGSCTC